MSRRKPFFVVPLAVTITGSAAAGYPASNLARHKALGLTWRNTGGGALTVSFGGTRQVNFVAVLSANAAPGTTIRVQCGSFDSGVDPFIDPAITREDGLYHSHTEFPSVQNASSATVTIGHSGAFEAAMLIVGLKVEPAKFYDYDQEFSIEDTGGADITRHGVWDEEPGLILRTLDMTLNWHNEAEWEGKFRPMIEKVGTTQPLFLAFDPEPTVYRQNRTYFGKFRKAPTASGRRKPNTWGGEYQILSLI